MIIILLHQSTVVRKTMEQVPIKLTRKMAEGFIIPLGPANLVAIKTDVGLVGCGAFDVAALDSFSYPAVKVRPAIGPSITDTDDILKGIVREANRSAMGRGIKTGMTGRQALELL
jgi:uncharacterized protein YunC (DUF1805 family)